MIETAGVVLCRGCESRPETSTVGAHFVVVGAASTRTPATPKFNTLPKDLKVTINALNANIWQAGEDILVLLMGPASIS